VTRRAFVSFGGWEEHDPRACAEWAARVLRDNGFEVDMRDTLAPLLDDRFTRDLDLVVPVWSLAAAEDGVVDALVASVERGVGFAGFHGAASTFWTHNAYRRLVGGSFVWHPPELEYEVEPVAGEPFRVTTEQYYLHVDPANDVIATTRFEDGTTMPLAWRRSHGAGRVFYSALGHSRAVLDEEPVRALFVEGALWAARRS
jgi:hypothetical protein